MGPPGRTGPTGMYTVELYTITDFGHSEITMMATKYLMLIYIDFLNYVNGFIMWLLSSFVANDRQWMIVWQSSFIYFNMVLGESHGTWFL